MNYQKVSADQFANILNRPPPEILIYMLQVAEVSRRDPDRAPVIAFRDIPKTKPTTLPREFGWLFCGRGGAVFQDLPSEEEAMARLKKFVPFLDDLCFEGNYCLAGSCPVVACLAPNDQARYRQLSYLPQDADFYPYYDARVQHGKNVTDDDLIRGGYGMFIEDMNDICGGDLGSRNGKTLAARYPFMSKSHTYRNRHCTTISIAHSDEAALLMAQAGIEPRDQLMVCKSYQIIHRAHSSPVSVVVGFDQICCKAFYDGEHIYFTLDAALAVYFRINPIDWRRESPSHLRRAWKYFERYGFTPIFPGLSFSLADELIKSSYASYYLPRARLVKENIWNYERVGANTKEASIFQLEFRHLEQADYINMEDTDDNLRWTEFEESDYGDDVTPVMALNYRCLSAAIKNKPDRMLVFASKPAQIIDQYHTIDIRKVLQKLTTGSESNFYMGTPRCRAVSDQMSRLALRQHGHSHCHVGFMFSDQMEQFTTLHRELTELFEHRVEQLEGLVKNNSSHLAKVEFLKSNPGAQFTASFHPIIRKSPREYFGCRYQHLELTIWKQAKLFCLHLRKIGVVFRGWDLNLMKLVFAWMDRLLITDMMEPLFRPANAVTVLFGVEMQSTSEMTIESSKNTAKPHPLPWMEPKVEQQTQAYATIARLTAEVIAANQLANQPPVRGFTESDGDDDIEGDE